MRRSADYIRERENEILAMLKVGETISTMELCEKFSISPSSARNQLNSMQQRGLLIRTHGGAKALPSNEPDDQLCSAVETTVNSFEISYYKEKEAVAVAASSLVKEGDIVAICGGTTTYLFAKELSKMKNITVVTNSVWVASELISNESIDVRMCGGVLNHSKGALSGPAAESFFRNIYADKAFIGADSVSLEWGVSSANTNISHLENLVSEQCETCYVLVDHTKFDRHMKVDKVLSSDKIDALITDGNISDEFRVKLEQSKANVIIADLK